MPRLTTVSRKSTASKVATARKRKSNKELDNQRKQKSNEFILGFTISLFLLLKRFGHSVALLAPKKKSQTYTVDIKSIHGPKESFMSVNRNDFENQELENVKNHVYTNLQEGAKKERVNSEIARTLRKNINDKVLNRVIEFFEKHQNVKFIDVGFSKKPNIQTKKEANKRIKKITIQFQDDLELSFIDKQLAAIGNDWVKQKLPKIKKSFEQYIINDTNEDIDELFKKHSDYVDGTANSSSCASNSSQLETYQKEYPIPQFDQKSENVIIEKQMDENDFENIQYKQNTSSPENLNSLSCWNSQFPLDSQHIITTQPPPPIESYENFVQEGGFVQTGDENDGISMMQFQTDFANQNNNQQMEEDNPQMNQNQPINFVYYYPCFMYANGNAYNYQMNNTNAEMQKLPSLNELSSFGIDNMNNN